MIRFSTCFMSIVIAGSLAAPLHAQSRAAKAAEAAGAEAKRQVRAMQASNDTEGLTILTTHKGMLEAQIRSGNVDLRAIVDEHNAHHDGTRLCADANAGQLNQPSSASAQREAETPAAEPKKRKRSNEKDGPAPILSQYDRRSAYVPPAHRPVGAKAELVGRLQGFPATYVMVMELSYKFPNGNWVDCGSFDPREYAPTPESVGRKRGCDVSTEEPDGHTQQPFKKGERLDINFGNTSGVEFPGAATISNSTLVMTRDGRISIGKSAGFISKSGGNGAGGGRSSIALQGRYDIDGHLLTVTDESGEVFVGFITSGANGDDGKLGHIYINGEHFWDRKD